MGVFLLWALALSTCWEEVHTHTHTPTHTPPTHKVLQQSLFCLKICKSSLFYLQNSISIFDQLLAVSWNLMQTYLVLIFWMAEGRGVKLRLMMPEILVQLLFWHALQNCVAFFKSCFKLRRIVQFNNSRNLGRTCIIVYSFDS